MVEIRDKQEMLLSSEGVVERQKVHQILECFRDELDDHRLAINENTGELAATNEAIDGLNVKLDKLAERLDELTLLVKGKKDEKQIDIAPLSGKEKEVFQALYVLTESQPCASYNDIARKACLTKELVISYVASMIRKGVPVLKRHDGRKVYLRVEPQFREKQAKGNILGLNALLTGWIPRQ